MSMIVDISISLGSPVCAEGYVAMSKPCNDPDVLGFPCFSSSHLSHLNSKGSDAHYTEGHESLSSEVPIPHQFTQNPFWKKVHQFVKGQ